MKTKDIEEGRRMSFGRKELHLKVTPIIIAIVVITSLNSCVIAPWHGDNGRPGNAFVALTWTNAKPEYIDAGSSGIPPVFYWDEYYPAMPGYYTLYYEGSVWNAYAKSFYAWEINYEIWRMEGEDGGLYHHGADGADTYFTLECNPYGPYVYEDINKNQPVDYEIIQNSGDEITIEKINNGFGIRVTYKKAEPGSIEK